MENKTKILTAGLVAVMLLIPTLSVYAAVPQPYIRAGVAYVDVGVAPKGSRITAWIDGTRYSGVTGMVSDDLGSYNNTCDGNATAMTLKTGGDAGDLVIYIYEWDPLMYIANEVGTWSAGTTVNANLNIAPASQPKPLKLNELVVTPSSGNDYVFIYNPSAIALTDYQLEDNDGWSMSLGSGSTQVGDCTCFNLTGDILSSAGDELKLVWTNPTSTIAAGNNVCIDRVEYGYVGTGPDNTSMSDAPVPGTGQSIKRAPTNGTDTEDCAADFVVGAATPRPGVGAVTPGAVKSVGVSNDTDKVKLSWSTVSGATGYYVYKSTDRFAVFPSGWTKSPSVATTYWSDAAGTYTNSITYYYIVRAYTTGASPEEGSNSSMACKIRKIYHVNPTGASLNVISLPYNCSYKNASHIVAAIEGGNGTGTGSPSVNISKVLKWNNATQNWGYSWSYALGKWSGTDFSIVPGDGIAIYVKANFSWTVVGSDLSCPRIYHVNPTGASLNVISLPFTMAAVNALAGFNASDIVAAIEGGNGTGTGSPSVNISKVLKWNNATQNWGYSWSYALGKWSGTDFSIVPGDGIAIYVKANFTWTPVLITPAV